MALQASGPIRWSALNIAYGNNSNASLSISSIRNSTVGVGLSNVSMSNFQNACIPLNNFLLYRFQTGVTTSLANATAGTTIFGNSNGSISYVNSITVPSADNYAIEWNGFFKINVNGQQRFQMASDDGSEFTINNVITATHYGNHPVSPPGSVGTITLTPGTYPFRLRFQETGGGEACLISYTVPSETPVAPNSTTTTNFVNGVFWNYRPIVKLDANDLFYRQQVSVNSQIATWSNMGTDGTLRHASGASGNSTTLPTLGSDANGHFVSFNRTNQQHFTIGNLEFDQFRSTDTSPLNIKGLTIFVVARMPTTNAGSSERIFDFGAGQAANNIIIFRASTNNRMVFGIYTGSTINGQRIFNNTIDGAFHVYTFVVTNGNPITMTLSVDNQSITSISDTVTLNANIGNRTTTLNYIGRSNWSADSYLTGDVRELLVFREVIDGTTQTRMNRYLMYKWGIREFMPPVTSGMVGLYTGESWTGTQWTDLSASGNHVTTFSGTVTTSTLNGLTTLTGTTATTMTWPIAILPTTYTLFHVTRYNGTNFSRIFNGSISSTGVNPNWLSGFWGGFSGVAHHGGWLTQSSTSVHGTNWVLSSDQNLLYRSNGVNRTTLTPTGQTFARLNINTGNFGGEQSQWACACVIVYNRTLTLDEIIQVETYLNRRYNVY